MNMLKWGMKTHTRASKHSTHPHWQLGGKENKTAGRVYLNRLCMLIMNDLNIHD